MGTLRLVWAGLMVLAVLACSGLQASPARAAGTDADLKAKVLAETPGLARAVKERRTARVADLVLRWAAPRIPLAPVRARTQGRSAADIYYKSFAPPRAGAACYEAADFYSKLLALFGVRTHVLVFGQKPGAAGFQHAVVLARVRLAGAERYVLFDPTFAAELRYERGGGLVPIDDVVRSWGTPRFRLFSLRLGNLSSRPVLVPGRSGKLQATTCARADPSATGCSFARFARWGARALGADGIREGSAGYFQLLVESEWFGAQAWDDLRELTDMQWLRYRHWVEPRVPRATAPPVITGDPRVGGTLMLSDGQWSAPDPIVSFGRTWLRCEGAACTPVGHGRSYTVTAADAGKTIGAAVSARTHWDAGPNARAAATAPVSP